MAARLGISAAYVNLLEGNQRSPSVAVLVALTDDAQFLTFLCTTDRPVFNRQTQDRRLVVALGREVSQAERVSYADRFIRTDPGIFVPIGILCYSCPRQGRSQREHQPSNIRLRIDADRRGSTRYES